MLLTISVSSSSIWVKKKLLLIFAILMLCCSYTAKAQILVGCPLNIDFALGDFTNWQCYIGGVTSSVTQAGVGVNTITVTPSLPTANRQVIVPAGKAVDPYGGFSISPPDGSNFCVKLGNDGTGSQAERLSYTFTIPQDQTDFQITYQYAIVLEDPGHPAEQQPRFTAKVVDVASGNYIACGAFEYVATANLPGFQHGGNGSISDVIYKGWTPVTLSLAGYQGKQIRLEFTTADCTQGGHFGYAYVDVNANCSNLVVGTDYCTGSAAATLTGPAGFQQYRWYNNDRSVLIDSTSRSIVVSPPPPDGTQYILDVVPYPGFGCNNTINATVHAEPAINFNITDPPGSCGQVTLDLTAPAVTQGNDANLTYSYWQDSVATVSLISPKTVTTAGTYYIQASSPSGCSEIKPVHAMINQVVNFRVTDPAATCLGTPTDITLSSLVTAVTKNLKYTYWQDAAASVPLTNPTTITTAGTYYIEGTSPLGCVLILPVHVMYFALPVLITNNPAAVCFPATVDITTTAVTQGSDHSLKLTYWKDTTALDTLQDPTKVATTGTYYIKAVNGNGCIAIEPVKVVVNPLPQLVTTNPPDVCIPDVIDITTAAVTAGSTDIANLTYWRDSLATSPLTSPTAVADSGVYYIKATNSLGCQMIKPVTVLIHKLPVLYITPPAKIYKPGTIDITLAAVTKGSSPGLALTYWRDSVLSISVSYPKAINDNGTVFIKATNKYGCYTIKRLDLIVADIPQINVPTAFTPAQAQNTTLYPFLIGIQTFRFFDVYNKWGNLVYRTTDLTRDKGWNGMYKSNLTFLETYTWVCEGYDYVGNLVHKTGNTIMLK